MHKFHVTRDSGTPLNPCGRGSDTFFNRGQVERVRYGGEPLNTVRIVGLAVVLLLAAGSCGTAAAQQMDIDEVGNVTAGEMVIISGTTNIAPGNHLTVTVTPVGFAPTNKSEPGGAGGTSGRSLSRMGTPPRIPGRLRRIPLGLSRASTPWPWSGSRAMPPRAPPSRSAKRHPPPRQRRHHRSPQHR
ncbi:protein of unknown function [Methanoculleus bourgensis]|uniref:Uncharacterized protein n=1 Tax=Methanoculleus bourgensis TaxID=83986 RepID=A0A120N6W2_9EURY|nr:protein of unknown function [Methanoculleus bourgensis]